MSEEKEKTEAKLNDRHKKFADFYVGEAALNATRAAKLAGYQGDENTLAVTGSRLLRNAKVRTYIDEQLDDLTLTTNEVLSILTRQAKGSLADVLDGNGNFDLADAKKRGVDGLLKKLKVREFVTKNKDGDQEIERTYEYEIHDAKDAAVHLGRYRKLFTDKTEITGKDGKPIQVIQMTLEDWRKDVEARRAQAEETAQMFEV